MATIKLTSKRQATFPRAVCEEMNLRPGDRIELTPAEVDGQQVWVLRPKEPLEMPWIGCLEKYARGKDHSMAAIVFPRDARALTPVDATVMAVGKPNATSRAKLGPDNTAAGQVVPIIRVVTSWR